MTTKTPYELRTDILQMALEYLENQFRSNLRMYEISIETMTKFGKVVTDEMLKIPKFPTSEDILAQANKFYDFVGKSK